MGHDFGSARGASLGGRAHGLVPPSIECSRALTVPRVGHTSRWLTQRMLSRIAV